MKLPSSATRWWDLPAAALLTVAILTSATRLVATKWTDELYLTQNIAFLGIIAGLALGQSRFQPRLAGLFAFFYGVFAVPWQLGARVNQELLWSERLAVLGGRLNRIIIQIIRHEVVTNSLLFVVLIMIVYWVLSAHAGYSLTRYGQAWRAVIPAGVVMFIIHSFDAMLPQRASYLAVYLFFSLVLVARAAYLQDHHRWQQSRTALPPHLGLDFIRFTLVIAGLLIILAWTAPALAEALPAAEKAFNPVRRQWYELRDRFDNAFASLRSSVGVMSDYYGSSVLLGRGSRLTDNRIFSVQAPEYLPPGIRFYWQARVYDTYVDGQWLNTLARSRAYKPEANDLVFPNLKGRWEGDFQFVAITNIATLFSPPQPMWVSRAGQVEMSLTPDGSVDIYAFRATPALGSGQVYQAHASISTATEAQLRLAGVEYPAWILDHYLQLPSTITSRTRQLAETITSDQPTPYDKVTAITNYLRKNITYKEIIAEKPTNQDAIDWFLFDLREGFCNYYASAEVVLLRSIGIPARWAVGYAQSELLPDGTYLVRQRDAHAWPEVYFPGLGWVEFEPTAVQPALLRLPGNLEELGGNLSGDPRLDEERLRQQNEDLLAQREDRIRDADIVDSALPARRTPHLTYALILLALILLAVLYRLARALLGIPSLPVLLEKALIQVGLKPPQLLQHWARQAEQAELRQAAEIALVVRIEAILQRAGIRSPAMLHRWAHWASLSPLERAYQEINTALQRLGKRPQPTQTPTERAAALIALVPDAAEPAQRLIQEYQLGIFSSQLPDLPVARQASIQIRRLSYRAMLERLLERLRTPDLNKRLRQVH